MHAAQPGIIEDRPSNRNTEPSLQQPRTNYDRKLKTLQVRTNDVLFRTSTVFPFTLFPDDLIIDRVKVSVVQREFFMAEQITSLNIDDILNVTLGVGPLFATLSIHDRFFAQKNPIEIRYLPKTKGLRAQQIIQGLLIAKREDIALENISDENLISLSKRIGKVRL